MTSKEVKTFGPRSDPRSFIKIPKGFLDSQSLRSTSQTLSKSNMQAKRLADQVCLATIRTLGGIDVSSFYEIWEAIVAVNGMCIRFGDIGTAWYRGA